MDARMPPVDPDETSTPVLPVHPARLFQGGAILATVGIFLTVALPDSVAFIAQGSVIIGAFMCAGALIMPTTDGLSLTGSDHQSSE